MAFILYQKPVLVAVHAREMLKGRDEETSDSDLEFGWGASMADLPEIQRAALEARSSATGRARPCAHAVFAVLRTRRERSPLSSGRAGRGCGQNRARAAEEGARGGGSARGRAGAAALVRAQRARRSARLSTSLDNPQQLIEQLGDGVPILLLPVRVETKFARSPARRGSSRSGSSRRRRRDPARKGPHDRLKRRRAGDYWKARALANALTDEAERARAHEAAWNVLANRHGAYRAGWIARATRPVNWSDTITDPESLAFPQVETKPEAWTEAPRSFVLPDRFVVMLFSGTLRLEQTGSAIPDDLVLGPDPLQSEGFVTRDPATGRIVIDEDLKWLVDFDRAVEVGMALQIPLSPPWDSASLERLVVLGIRASSGAREGRRLVERLFESHRYGRGMSIARQGTPTNNTDDAKSGFTSGGGAATDETFTLEEDPAALVATDDPLRQPDGQRLAEALGIPLESVRATSRRGRDRRRRGLAMNRALWAATMGGFLREMIKPLVRDADDRRAAAVLHAYVLWRGLLPAMRVGSQPYGVLATSSLAAGGGRRRKPAGTGSFWTRPAGAARTLDGVWRRLASKVSLRRQAAATRSSSSCRSSGSRRPRSSTSPARPSRRATCANYIPLQGDTGPTRPRRGKRCSARRRESRAVGPARRRCPSGCAT